MSHQGRHEEFLQEENKRRLQAAVDLYQVIKQNDSLKAFELYQHYAALNPRDKRGRTPLHAAAELGRDNILRFLLEQKGVGLNDTDIQGYTALHLATINDHSDCVFYLLERGANAQLVDANGHLPSFYASTETKNKFDNPPIVYSSDQYATVNHWINKAACDTGPIPPEGPRKEVCHYFHGSLWVPDISTRWRILPIWDLVYDHEHSGDLYTRFNIPKKRSEAKKKWIHLPIVSKELVLELTKAIYAASGRSRILHRRIENLIDGMFKQVDIRGPEGKVHFKLREIQHSQQTGSDEEEQASNSIYATVFPVIDVDKKDYVSLARIAQEQHEVRKSSPPKRDLKLRLNWRAKRHFEKMLMALFMGQPLPRCLDQSYYQDLDDEKLDFLNNDQVIVRYSKYMKARCLWALETADNSQNLDVEPPQKNSEPSKDEHVRRDPESVGKQVAVQTSFEAPRVPLSPPRGRRSNSAASEINMSAESAMQIFEFLRQDALSKKDPIAELETPLGQTEGQTEGQTDSTTAQNVDTSPPWALIPEWISLDEPDDFLTAQHFWLFKLDTDTIVTMYPERWDIDNEQNLHRHILERVSEDRDIRDTLHGDRFDLNMDLVSKAIIKACMSFEANAVVPYRSPDDSPGQLRKAAISYAKAFSASINRLYAEVVEHFEELKLGMGSLRKDPNRFYAYIQRETAILIEVDDIIGEILMIKRVLLDQSEAYDTFKSEVLREKIGNLPQKHPSPLVARFEALQEVAERVRSMVTTLLDLRATLEDALARGQQSTMIFVFTAVSVLFAPLSVIVGVLALNVRGLPEEWTPSPLAEVFGLTSLGTAGLCLLLWGIFKVYQSQSLSHTINRTRLRHHDILGHHSHPGSRLGINRINRERKDAWWNRMKSASSIHVGTGRGWTFNRGRRPETTANADVEFGVLRT